MSIDQKVKNTPLKGRPLVNHNGITDYPADEEYAEYLEILERYAHPSHPDLPDKPTSLEARMEKVEHDVDDLTCIIAGF